MKCVLVRTNCIGSFASAVVALAVAIGLSVSTHGERVGTQIETILEAAKDWELLGEGFQLTADSTVDKNGDIYFTDARRNRIYRIDLDGRIAIWKEDSGGAHGVAFGPDDRLYVCQHDRKRIIAYAPDGKESIVVEGPQTHHLTVTRGNGIYFTEPPKHRIWFVDVKGRKRVVASALEWPRSVRVSPDQSLLVVNDPPREWVWAFTIQPGGSLANRKPFCRLRRAGHSPEVDAGGVAFDADGFLYVATPIGVQVCDRTNGVVAVIDRPSGAESGLANVMFGGRDMRWLYVTDGDRMYRRPVKRQGAVPWIP